MSSKKQKDEVERMHVTEILSRVSSHSTLLTSFDNKLIWIEALAKDLTCKCVFTKEYTFSFYSLSSCIQNRHGYSWRRDTTNKEVSAACILFLNLFFVHINTGLNIIFTLCSLWLHINICNVYRR